MYALALALVVVAGRPFDSKLNASTYCIAGGGSEQELYHLLHQDKSRLLGLVQPKAAAAEDVQQLLQHAASLSSSLNAQAGEGCELVVASSIWTKNWPIKPEYAAAAKELFQVRVGWELMWIFGCVAGSDVHASPINLTSQTAKCVPVCTNGIAGTAGDWHIVNTSMDPVRQQTTAKQQQYHLLHHQQYGFYVLQLCDLLPPLWAGACCAACGLATAQGHLLLGVTGRGAAG